MSPRAKLLTSTSIRAAKGLCTYNLNVHLQGLFKHNFPRTTIWHQDYLETKPLGTSTKARDLILSQLLPVIKMEAEERPAKLRKLQHETSANSEATSVDIVTDQKDDQANDSIKGEETNPEEQPKEVPFNNDQPMSKSAMKRMRKKQQWEEDRPLRKQIRKEKQLARRERKKLEREEAKANGAPDEPEPKEPPARPHPTVSVPLTILLDCGFDEQMTEKEIVSLAAQVTRCYSENRKALYRPEICLSSWGGRMKTRFETVLQGPHLRWTGFHIEDGDFVQVAAKAKTWMQDMSSEGLDKCSALKSDKDPSIDDGEVIYLTADSDDTLEELKPFSTYIIGGIVDRNRHKGICYKRAQDRKIRTAKLPIGEFIQMSSRTVLTTNHVYEIMLRWLELGDWGQAFIKVIPKRKGGTLKSGDGGCIAATDSNGLELDDGGEEAEQSITA